MADLIISLGPLALGIVMSPLAIMALVAVLLSHRARGNGIAFLAGWAVAVVLVLGASFAVAGVLEVHERVVPPLWVPLVRLALSLILGLAAWRIYRGGEAKNAAMSAAQTPTDVAAAATQLPGWLTSVESFTALRSFLLGVGIFALNPVDLSCAALAAMDIRIAALTPTGSAAALLTFGLAAVAPIAVPVGTLLVRGESAAPVLTGVRSWIASHTALLNAVLVLVIALLQLQKAISALLSY